MSNTGFFPETPIEGSNPPIDKTRVAVPINWVSNRTQPPSTELVIANFYVPSDFLVEGELMG